MRPRFFSLASGAACAACFGILLALTYVAHAEDAERIKSDDGFFPLTPNQVTELQEILLRFGYKAGPINGVVNPEMAKAAEALAGLLRREIVRRPSGRELVLACEIKEGSIPGYKSIQIMVDEQRGIVIYNFQMPASNDLNPIRKINENYIDMSMKIVSTSDNIITATDLNGILAINKRDGKFVHSYVTSIPTKNGSLVSVPNTHSGTCAKSPFN